MMKTLKMVPFSRGHHPQHDKEDVQKTTADVPNGKKLDAFPLRSETK